MRPQHRVPRAAVAAPGSLEMSKARLDGAESTLGWWKLSLPMAGGWNEMTFQALPNYNSVISLLT